MCSGGQYCYRIYGMRLESDRVFSWLVPEDDNNGNRETVTLRRMTSAEQEAFTRVHGECLCGSGQSQDVSWLCNSTLQMQIAGGRQLLYHPRAGAEEEKLETYLLGYGMAMLAGQQGRCAFHCSAVANPGRTGALLVCGESGAGKSTLTDLLLARHTVFLADDMAVVGKEPELAVYPGYPWRKLCRDALERGGYEPRSLSKVADPKEKYYVPCDAAFATERVPLRGIVLLELGEKLEMRRATGLSSLEICLWNLFLRRLWRREPPGVIELETCLEIAEAVPVYLLTRPAAGDSTAGVAAEVHRLLVGLS